MPKLLRLSGKRIVAILNKFGFNVAASKGSHVKLQRITQDKSRQTLTVPLHRELDKSTTQAIYRQALRYIPEEKLKQYFYTK